MRIPTFDAPQVAPQTTSLQTPAPAGASGYEAIQHGLENAGKVFDAAIEHSRQQAVAADTTDGETALTKGITEQMHGNSAEGGSEQGYLSLQGRDALASSADYMGRVEKLRQQIADSRGTDEAKKLFLARTGMQVEHTRATIESHAQQQRQVADVATLKAREDSALESIRLNIGNGAEVERQSVSLEGPIHALSLSPEDAAKNVEDWRRRVLATQIDASLDGGNWQAASALLDTEQRGRLGKLGDDFQKRIDTVKFGAEAEAWTTGVMGASRLPNGQIDEAKVWDALSKQDGEWQKKADPIVAQHLAHARRAWDEETKNISRESYTTVNRDGWAKFVASDLSEQLNERNPALWDQLKNGEMRDLDRLERLSRVRLNSKSAIREQAAIDKIGLNEWDAQLLRDPKAADRDMFLATHRDMSDAAKSELEKRQLLVVKAHDKGLSSSRSAFVRESVDGAAGFIAAKAGTKRQKDAALAERVDFEAQAGRAYDTFLSAHERAPLPKEVEDMRGRLIREYMSRGTTPLVPHTPEAGVRAGQDIAKSINDATAPQQPAPGRKIPEPARQRAIARIKQSGKPVSEDLIRQVYDYERQMTERASKGK